MTLPIAALANQRKGRLAPGRTVRDLPGTARRCDRGWRKSFDEYQLAANVLRVEAKQFVGRRLRDRLTRRTKMIDKVAQGPSRGGVRQLRCGREGHAFGKIGEIHDYPTERAIEYNCEIPRHNPSPDDRTSFTAHSRTFALRTDPLKPFKSYGRH
jgi:hypothetical protein